MKLMLLVASKQPTLLYPFYVCIIWLVGRFLRFLLNFCIRCSFRCQIAYGASNFVWESMHRCSHLHEPISKIITFTCHFFYSEKIKIKKKQRKRANFLRTTCRLRSMHMLSDACTIANKIKWEKKTNFKNFQSALSIYLVNLILMANAVA